MSRGGVVYNKRFNIIVNYSEENIQNLTLCPPSSVSSACGLVVK